MRALVQRDHGIALSTESMSPTRPVDGQVRIAVEFCGLNHLDLWLKRGGTGDRIGLPRIPGSDVLGVVAEVGPGVSTVTVGDRVLVYPGRSCGTCAQCIAGHESACRYFEVLGYGFDGGYADTLTVPAVDVVPVPADVSRQWAGVPVSYVTAWNALVAKGGLVRDQRVVVWGASGGLGNAALRIAEAIGAAPIALVGTPDKAQWLRDQGHTGDVVVRGEDLVRRVRDLTDGRGADLVLDHVGAATWADSMRMLAVRGHLAFCGVTSGHRAETDLRQVFGKQLTIAGTWLGDRRDFAEVVALLREQPDFLPVVDRVFPLEQADDAQRYLDDGRHSGKVLLTTADLP